MAVVYLNYKIHLRDRDDAIEEAAAPARINSPINSLGGSLIPLATIWLNLYSIAGAIGFVVCCPRFAAYLFNATIVESTNPVIPSTGNYITSEHIATDDQANSFPVGMDQFFKLVGFNWFIWYGTFEYAASSEIPPSGVEAYGLIGQRRWSEGFEHPDAAGGSGWQFSATLDASRHIGLLGYSLRSESNVLMLHDVAEHRVGLLTNRSWERLYIRIRKLPSATTRFWRTSSSVNFGVGLSITPNGALAAFHVTGASTEDLLSVSDILDSDRWYRIDVLMECGTTAHMLVYIDGVLALSVGGFPASGWGQAATTHTSSTLGSPTNTFNLGLDVDDWCCIDYPPDYPPGHEQEGETDLTGMDWLNGSKVVPIAPSGVTSSVNWVLGHVDWLARAFASNGAQGDVDNLTSVTASAVLEVTTDSLRNVEGDAQAIGNGAVALYVGMYARDGGGADARIGYKLAGAAAVDTVVATFTTPNTWTIVPIVPSGLTSPFTVSPLSLRVVKGADGSTTTVRALIAHAELLGVFGPEDGGAIPYPQAGVHAARYPNSPFARFGAGPYSPISIVAGTFVGNNTESILTFTAPLTWLSVRVTTGTTHSTFFYSSMQNAIGNWNTSKTTDGALRVEQDHTFVPLDGDDPLQYRYRIRIIGTQDQTNDGALTYAYTAFCDPGMRFSQNGILRHYRTGGGSLQTDLAIPAGDWGDGAEAAFFNRNAGGTATTIESYFKGRGQTAVSSLGAVAEAALATFVDDGILSTLALHWTSTGDEISYAVFKRDDGSGDPGVPAVIKLFSYTGDGAASRTINLTPESGVRPLWAIVVPRTAVAAIWRDHAHTGTTSTQVPTTVNAATGITGGGIDQLNVGSVLNASGVTFDVFIIMGGAGAGNGGFSTPGTFTPVPPIVPPHWPGPGTIPPTNGPVPVIPPVIPPGGGGGGPTIPPGGGGTDLEECPEDSQKVCNQALSYIGVTSPIVDINADATPESEQCRLHYEDAVATVLKSFPWLWATKYATLVLVAGTEDVPVNGDWQYSYRLPDDCVHARRLVDETVGRDTHPLPIRFRAGHDGTGTGLLYTDRTVEDGVELEYTCRPVCSAIQGDSIFREALTWFMAAKLAPGLSRNKLTATDCMKMYEHFIGRAQPVNANEQQPDLTQGDPDWIRDR